MTNWPNRGKTVILQFRLSQVGILHHVVTLVEVEILVRVGVLVGLGVLLALGVLK